MPAFNLSSALPFITSSQLVALADQPDVLFLDARFDVSAFDDSFFERLTVPFPDRLKRAVPKRRAEYVASRYCLQQALEVLGVNRFILQNDEARAPVWPEGIRGSLSHTHQHLCALITRRDDLLPGIDCEQIMSDVQARELARMIVSPAELALLNQCSAPFAQMLTMTFSAKESLYKALWPQLRQFFDFSAAEVTAWDPLAAQLVLTLTTTLSEQFFVGRRFLVKVQILYDELLTWIVGEQIYRFTS